MPAPRLKTHTLGCKVNQYETEYLREGLHQVGYRDASDSEPADLCVVNTCTVTAEGDSKSRQIIRQMARQNPDARIIVMGCYATRDPQAVAALPQVAEVITDKRELPDLLGRFGLIDVPDGISRFGNRHRAYVKVQDGCLLRCSYCIIPQVRPTMYSRPMPPILNEVRRLVDNGFREIVLTGVHLGHYGVDGNVQKPKSEWTRLSDLVRAIARLPGDFRIRLSSIEATEVTRELIAVMGEFADRVCPHLHICLQSGSDAILRKMNRRWGTRMFIDRCRMLHDRLVRPAITTDVIVGFPGESPADFQATCDTVRECEFSKIHIFPFSGRRGTPAAEMPEQLSKASKKERVAHLSEIERDLRERYFQSLIGHPLRVLVESLAPSGVADDLSDASVRLAGTSCRYAPVLFSGDPACIGRFVDVIAESATSDHIVAVVR